MDTVSESPKDRGGYRAARRAFIAACEKAHVDAVARLHPAKGPDGKPLFMDCAALGPRRAAKAALAVAYDAAGTGMMMDLLQLSLPKDVRLVLVHALDPALFAGVTSDPTWPAAMLGAVATEDLSRVRELAVLALGREDERLGSLLQRLLPAAVVGVLPHAATAAQAKSAIAQFFAAS